MAESFEVEGLAEFSEDLQEFGHEMRFVGESLEDAVDRGVEKTAEEFKRRVKRNIVAEGLVDTGELLNSWRVDKVGPARYEVGSSVDHALYLEFGTPRSGDEYTIPQPPFEAGDGNFLHFRPENPGDYPSRVVDENGWVRLKIVRHPGVDEYRYFRDAIDSITEENLLERNIEEEVDKTLDRHL